MSKAQPTPTAAGGRKPGLFTMPDGRNLFIAFSLVSSLFFLWGFCNGMIDVMDKHFQKELGLSLAQSAWVQFAHYLGYFLMALPAGWLASKFGYKGGIIAGLLIVAAGGFWFIEATKIAQFWAFLLGVCLIASGLTFLETVANPYSTVLGPKQFAATRINLAQSCNGIGWIFGPIVGSMFFYGQDASGKSTGSETLWIPYAAVGAFVLVLAVVFFFCKLPDINADDEFQLDEEPDPATHSGQHIVAEAFAPATSLSSNASIKLPAAAFPLLWLNMAVLAVAIGMIFSAIVAIPVISQKLGGLHENTALLIASGILIVIGSVILARKRSRITAHSIWNQPHFSGATLTQFFYVAAQCGIFAFFINYMTSQIPEVPKWVDETMRGWSATWQGIYNSLPTFPGWFIKWIPGWLTGWFEVHKSNGIFGLSDKGGSNLAAVGFGCFLAGRFIGAGLMKKYPPHQILCTFAIAAATCSLVIFLKLGWASAIALFLTYFFMSIMFPTIFSLGIHGLGSRAKNASSFIVMAIMGGAIMPKFMGHIGDSHGMSVAFIVPLICFVFITIYSFAWPKLTGGNTKIIVDPTRGH